MDVRHMDCCGFREISGLEDAKDPEDALLTFCLTQTGQSYVGARYVKALRLSCSHVVFTEVQGDGGYGRKFAAFIKAKKLGTVVESSVSSNPNTNNKLRGYIWVISPAALAKWWKANKEE